MNNDSDVVFLRGTSSRNRFGEPIPAVFPAIVAAESDGSGIYIVRCPRCRWGIMTARTDRRLSFGDVANFRCDHCGWSKPLTYSEKYGPYKVRHISEVRRP